MKIDYTVKLNLDKRREKKDGTYPIILRTIIFGKTIDIGTGLSVSKKHWSQSDPFVKKSFGDRYKLQNRKLKTLQLEIESKMDSLIQNERLDISHTHKEIKKLLTSSHSNLTFEFFNEHINKLKEDNKLGTARWYKLALNAVKEFSKNRKEISLDFPLSDISPIWLMKFEKWYLTKNTDEQAINGLSVYLRAIRALYNKALQAGRVEGLNPFTNYKIKSKETKKRALSKEEFKLFSTAECKTGWHERAKDFFFGSYYLYGMSFIDMCHLKLSDIKSNGRIEYKRSKTGKNLSIKINDALEDILTPYLSLKNQDDYIFNVLRHDQSESQQYNAIKNATKRCNKALRDLAESIQLDKISTYTARHSFASHLLENLQPIEIISQMMGHKSIRTTQVYLKGFNTTVLDEAQDGLVII